MHAPTVINLVITLVNVKSLAQTVEILIINFRNVMRKLIQTKNFENKNKRIDYSRNMLKQSLMLKKVIKNSRLYWIRSVFSGEKMKNTNIYNEKDSDIVNIVVKSLKAAL